MNYYRIKEKFRDSVKNKDTIYYKILYVIHRILLRIVYGEWGLFRVQFVAGREKRRLFGKSKLFNPIKQMKQKYYGKRCFIVATGSSLKIKDVEKLKGEYSFGMNSLVDIFNKTEWRPTFYAIQDCTVWKKYKKKLIDCEDTVRFFIADIVRIHRRDEFLFSIPRF